MTERTPKRSIRGRSRADTNNGQAERPFLRVLTPRNSPFESNRWRLGLPALNEKRLREVLEYQDARERPDYGVSIDDSYDPLSWDRINS
jgi:hypothetical protein